MVFGAASFPSPCLSFPTHNAVILDSHLRKVARGQDSMFPVWVAVTLASGHTSWCSLGGSCSDVLNTLYSHTQQSHFWGTGDIESCQLKKKKKKNNLKIENYVLFRRLSEDLSR